MKFHAFIFNDYELDILLNSRKNKLSAKKSLILYFLTLPKISQLIDMIYLPESVLDDEQFTQSIFNIFSNIGISVSSKLIFTDNLLDYNLNPLPIIKNYQSKYKFQAIHYKIDFGNRSIQKSPRNEDYIIHSQYNWTNVLLVNNWCEENNLKLLVESNLYFTENSPEDYYIHMRQILWEGIEIFRRMGKKFNKINLIINPFYPKLKGLNGTHIEPSNIANTTLRCINECLTKEKMEILIKSCVEFNMTSYLKYIKFFRDYSKDNTINCLLTSDCLRNYIRDWDFKNENLEKAQEIFLSYFLQE